MAKNEFIGINRIKELLGKIKEEFDKKVSYTHLSKVGAHNFIDLDDIGFGTSTMLDGGNLQYSTNSDMLTGDVYGYNIKAVTKNNPMEKLLTTIKGGSKWFGGKKLIGCPEGGSESTYWIELRDDKNDYGDSHVLCRDYGNGGIISTTYNSSKDIYIIFRIAANFTFGNSLIIQPMIVESEDLDKTFALRTKTNLELTNDSKTYESKIIEIEEGLKEKVTYSHLSKVGAHNLLHIAANDYTINGITYKINRNKNGECESVFIAGGQTANQLSYIELNEFIFDGTTYILSGCPNGGSTSSYQMDVDGEANDTGEGRRFTLGTPENPLSRHVRIRIAPGYSIPEGGLTFYPMIRLSTDTDSTFTPHAMTNQELTGFANNTEDDIAEVRALQVDNGCKNLLHIPASVVSKTINGVTFTVNRNEDGEVTSIVADGTAAASARFWVIQHISTGDYIVSGCPKNGSASTYFLQINYENENEQYITTASEMGSGLVLSQQYAKFMVAISIASGYTANNLEFYPMIRFASIADSTFEPYYRTVKQLDADLSSLETAVSDEITTATEMTLPNSKAGGLKVVKFGGKCEQKTTTGKNLIDPATYTYVNASNGMKRINVSDGVFGIKGSNGNDQPFLLNLSKTDAYVNVRSGHTYHFDGNANMVTDIFYSVRPSSDNSKVYAKDGESFTPDSDTSVRIFATIPANYTVPEGYTASPVLTEDTDTTFEPYTGGAPSPSPDYPQTIKSVVVDEVRTVGKNLIPLYGGETTSTQNANGLNFVLNSDQSIKVSGTKTSSKYADFIITLKEKIILKAGISYHLQLFGSDSGVSVQLRVQDPDTLEDYMNGINTFSKNPLQFQYDKDMYVVSVYITVPNSTAQNVTVRPFLCKSEVYDGTYSPYRGSSISLSSPITLNGIGDVKDEIVEKNGVFGKWKRFINIDLGGLTWVLSGNSSNISYYAVAETIIKELKTYAKTELSNILSSHFSAMLYSRVVETDLSGGIEIDVSNNGNNEIRIGLGLSTEYTTADALKTWLSSENAYMIAELAEPVFEPLPAADQIALRSLKTFDGVTHVEFFSDRYEYFSNASAWEQGTINAGRVDSTTRIRTRSPIQAILPGNYSVTISDGFTIMVVVDINGSEQPLNGWLTKTTNFTFPANAEFLGFVIKKSDESAITPSIIDSSCKITFNQISLDPDVELEYGKSKTGAYAIEAVNKSSFPYNVYAKPLVYGFHIDGGESDPASMVEYIADAKYMTPAYMDFSKGVFNYGSWEDVWFVRDCKPCILNQDGTVKAYLNKNDLTKDIYGNTVVIDSTLTGANVMVEFPKSWYKVVPDENNLFSASVYISPVKVDAGYKDYAYIDKNGNHKEHFYMPVYNGSSVNSVMRSLSGMAVSKSLTAQQEIAYCTANGDGWYTEDAGEAMLINFLLILMGKSTDTQTVFGRGIDTGGETTFNSYRTGAGNTKGFFYGTNTGNELVKVFGIENWWGLQWRRYAGDINDNGKRKIKLCYGNEDGSTVSDYNLTGEGYVDVGATPSGTSGGYISKMKFTESGMYSVVSSGSETTYYTDGQWFNNGQVDYALRGASAAYGPTCGALCVDLNNTASNAWRWGTSAAPSYK